PPDPPWRAPVDRAPLGADAARLHALGSCRHWLDLALAYRLDRDERRGEKIVSDLSDFIADAPVGEGPLWSGVLPVAVRAINVFLWAPLVADSPRFDPVFANDLHRFAAASGVWLDHHLAETPVSSAERAAGYAAAFVCGAALRETDYGARLLADSIAALERFARVGVSSDGPPREPRTAAAVLVAEAMLVSRRLAARVNRPFTAAFDDRLLGTLDYLRRLRAAGFPVFGETVPFAILPTPDAAPLDPRVALAFGAVAFRRGDLAPEDPPPLASLIAAGYDSDERFRALERPTRPVSTKLYVDGGVATVFHNDAALAVKLGDAHLERSRGAHADVLSFTLSYKGVPFIVDSGGASGALDPALARELLDARAHNVPAIDGEDYFDRAVNGAAKDDVSRPSLLEWRDDDDETHLAAQHYAYVKRAAPAVVKRTFQWYKRADKLNVKDELVGGARHRVDSRLTLHPDVAVERRGDESFRLTNADATIDLRFHTAVERAAATIDDARFAPTYWRVEPTKRIRFSVNDLLPAFYVIEFRFL
ncbi:MAG: hypothetical protein GF419_04125, partial [Ignavibacteriales bacterium]|nr:hypothetical protein [Ignavibacteriales bacterium]